MDDRVFPRRLSDAKCAYPLTTRGFTVTLAQDTFAGNRKVGAGGVGRLISRTLFLLAVDGKGIEAEGEGGVGETEEVGGGPAGCSCFSGGYETLFVCGETIMVSPLVTIEVKNLGGLRMFESCGDLQVLNPLRFFPNDFSGGMNSSAGRVLSRCIGA